MKTIFSEIRGLKQGRVLGELDTEGLPQNKTVNINSLLNTRQECDDLISTQPSSLPGEPHYLEERGPADCTVMFTKEAEALLEYFRKRKI